MDVLCEISMQTPLFLAPDGSRGLSLPGLRGVLGEERAGILRSLYWQCFVVQ